MIKYRSFCRAAVLLGGATLFMASIAHAEESTYFEGVPSTEDLIKALKGSEPPTATEKTRTVVLGSAAKPATAAREPVRVELPKVRFEYGSARLTTEGQQVLQRVAAALQSGELQSYRFQIEGHTDSRGSAEYNRSLSERRAAAAKAFLIQAGVAEERLVSVGKGEEAPIDKQNPESGVNRRVDLLRLSP